jgi:threonine synthase
VSDEQILEAYRLVAKTEGIFCEPSSATGLAGIKQAIADGSVDLRGKRVVCVLTGHGLKDPDTAIKGSAVPITIEPRIDDLLNAIV